MATHSKDFFMTHAAPFVSLRRHFWDYKLNTSKTHYIPESTEIQLPQGPPSPEIKGSIYYFLRDNEEESFKNLPDKPDLGHKSLFCQGLELVYDTDLY